jgi:segregation and condensation protein B
MQLDIAIEGVLFYKAGPVKKKELVKFFSCSEDDLKIGITALTDRLQNGATRLLETETEVQLVTAPELDGFIDSLRKDELKRDIGKAGAETLAIILYRGPITRAEIDRVRGVNSSYIIRNLMVRGLIERVAENKSYALDITPELLAHLGISNKTELPDYATILDQLEKFEAQELQSNNV